MVCLPSQREGLPRCIMEAMCAERPIIASNIRGCNDLLSSGCGELVQYNDTDAWVAGFTTLIQNPELRLTMKLSGYKKSKKLYRKRCSQFGYRYLSKVCLVGNVYSILLFVLSR